MEMFSLGKSEKIFQIKKFLQYNCLFFRIICSELLRTFTKETFLFEIFFHFSPIKTFPFGLILMGHISVFQVNDPKSMNFFYNFNIFRISSVLGKIFFLTLNTWKKIRKKLCLDIVLTSPLYDAFFENVCMCRSGFLAQLHNKNFTCYLHASH